ncbi:invasion associated locus B family protein [Microvirga makkahensis]|uniref:Invasion associated locus B family protein n=1 Tax=Microvirga makkahensis TaxID=1128670 RepID=A0A7X3SRV2_9HYPH|nr:invasion associated locus B family protein [Microvirga makkahensis]MXQ14479.1 invasion associated locus B family protein [Microvirga makkahensis]
MLRHANHAPSLMLSACLMLTGASPAAGQQLSSQPYRVKPSEVVVPPDVKLGQYRRVIRPFENWTLICDENLDARQMVCNITQVIENQAGRMAFSWSLAATKDGKPYMILRTPPTIGSNTPVSLQFEGRPEPIDVRIDGCNEIVCVGMLPVGPLLREQIDKAGTPRVSYLTAAGETVTIPAPLKGLAMALKAIK